MNTRRPTLTARHAALALFALIGGGCSAPITASSLDAPTALSALTTTLDAWKKGEEITALKAASPSIVAQDMDWLGGAKLLDYQVKGDGKPMDSNLRVPVKLTIKSKDGKDVTKDVSYLVTTSPAVTVFRDIH